MSEFTNGKIMRLVQVLTATLLGVLALPGFGAGSADPLFQDHFTLNVEISVPLSTLVRDRPEVEYLPGRFSYLDGDGNPVVLDVQVRTRGNFRHRNCDFPPMTLNFRKSQVEGTLFSRQDKLKMVTHCKITRQYEQSVVREYLAYRLLNTLTDLSFGVRLLQVTWVDSDERRGRMVRNAFLIEHKDRLAARTGMAEQEIESADLSTLQPDHLNLSSMFQYLIGNFDFSPIAGSDGECCHNYAMFEASAESLVAIPYDFDFSGIVNAPNAVPNTEHGVERVGQRVYQGYCVNNDQVEGSISVVKDARSELYAIVANQKELEPTVRESIARYMDGFYEVVENPVEVDRKIIGECH